MLIWTIGFIVSESLFMIDRTPSPVYHGFKCVSREETLNINVPDKSVNDKKPNEFRVDPHSRKIPDDWGRRER